VRAGCMRPLRPCRRVVFEAGRCSLLASFLQLAQVFSRSRKVQGRCILWAPAQATQAC
jgi:hypothetical protein